MQCNAMFSMWNSLLTTLYITHTCQFTTISTVEQLELLPKLNTKSIVWEHFGLHASWQRWQAYRHRTSRYKICKWVVVAKMEIAKFVVCIKETKVLKYMYTEYSWLDSMECCSGKYRSVWSISGSIHWSQRGGSGGQPPPQLSALFSLAYRLP